ncbi:iron ABC transporter permease [Campylobacter volucris]|nr:iron ABC transporter permease [Campylobacter volucris]MBF7042078.1 iron ABC transporter permease [Campylobacter volucris]
MEEIIIWILNMLSKNIYIFLFLIFSYVVFYFLYFDFNDTKLIFFEIKLPRFIMAILIGVILSISGLITQNVFANPIADPYIIGIAQAASFGAILAFVLQMSDYYYGIFAFLVSSVFSFFIFNISKNKSMAILLIIGISFSSFLGAFSSFFIYYMGEDSFKITSWFMGYLGLASWDKILILALPCCIAFFYFFIHKNELNILLSNDEEQALSLGVDCAKLKRNLLIVSSLIISFAISFSGIIGFVGLIIPHIARLFLKTYDNNIILPFCALFGGLFLLMSDYFSKTLLNPIEIPIGVITSFFGAPLFLYLALRLKEH